ncbi:hypothetical protein TNCV_2350501 [Trichonephila clavipes]|uniref:Uncharacterized protein n=1 Tax=Trichonephila clavipes TaxID=2585209 RepID=A0A8X6SW09_TRICX|nr:hypothetical protein TNCV_2350501 [Trichonephila clavipes]
MPFYLSNEAKRKAWGYLTSYSKSVIPDFPRPVVVASFRLWTGHDCMNVHLFKIRLMDTSVCTLCDSGESMDKDPIDQSTAILSFNSIVLQY